VPPRRSLLVRCYRWLLAGAPRAFRDRYLDEAADAMAALATSERERRGRLAAGALWIRGLTDAAGAARRERRGWRGRGGLTGDLRYGARMIRRHPGYALVVVLTLALGIGGVSAVFTLADPMIFRALPYADSDRIVTVLMQTKDGVTSPRADDFQAMLDHGRSLSAVSTLGWDYVGSYGDVPDVYGAGVTSNFFDLTGIRPLLGRTFQPDEYRDELDPPVVAMLTWPFWRQAFGGRADVVGHRLLLGGRRPLSMEIVGVLPREFFYPEAVNRAPDFLVPNVPSPRFLGDANYHPTVLARVKPGYSLAQAASELQPLATAVEHAVPAFERGRQVRLVTLQDELFRDVRTPLLLLFIATGSMLALACVNLAHLTGARSRTRAREFVVRRALGATRWQLARQVLVESALLCGLGAAAGVLVGQELYVWGMSKTPEFSPIYRLIPAGLDLRVVVFAAGTAAASLLAVGLWPAWRLGRGSLRADLAELPGRRRALLVNGEALALAGQTAFAVGVVIISALAVRSFVLFAGQPRGFDPAHTSIASIRTPASEAADPPALLARFRDVVAALRGVRGVEAAAVANGIPALSLPERPVDPRTGAAVRSVIAYRTSGGLPQAMGMRLEAGRLFDDGEAFGAQPVAVVDRSAADALWPGRNPLGQAVHLRDGRAYTVVGVLARVNSSFYAQYAGEGTVLVTLDAASATRLLVAFRDDGRGAPARAALAAALTSVDPAMTLGRVGAMTSYERAIGQPRFLATALGLLGTLTALLAGVGVFGVVSHRIARRTREIGIRLALGASRISVRALVIRQALGPAAFGVAGGLVAAFWWSRTLRSVLVGVPPHDAWSFVGAGAGIFVVVALGSGWPARHASRINPVDTLRAD
jgi:putative ABC transport system permease protein